MARKDEKAGRTPNEGKEGTTSASLRKPKKSAPTFESKLSTRDVKNSILIVFSGMLFSQSELAKRLRGYRKQPSQLLYDFSFLTMVCAVIIGMAYLVFVFLYYGSETSIFSSTGGLLLLTQLNVLVFRILYVAGITFFIVTAYRFLKSHIKKSELLRSSFFIVFLAIFAYSLVFSAAKLRPVLIKLNYTVSRADELVSIGRFDLAKEILLLYPEDQQLPSYFTRPPNPEEWDSPMPPYMRDKERNEALKTFDNFAQQLYDNGNYQEIIRTVCSLSHTDLSEGIMPHWQTAAYILSHDPAWGPENTLNLVNQIGLEFPECKRISSPFWLAIPQPIAWMIQEGFWEQPLSVGYLYRGTARFLPSGTTIDETLPDTNFRDICEDYRRCEYDMRLIEDYLLRFPDDSYADYGKFILGHWDQIVQEGYETNKHTYALAFYERGLQQYKQRDYESALKTFQGFVFLEELNPHPWRDDALWRAAMCYMHLGKYIDALEPLSRMDDESDGYVPEYADRDSNVLYIADVLMPIDDLARVVTENLFPDLLPILKYTYAERLLVHGSYAYSREIFVEIANQFRGTVFQPGFGKNFSYAILADQKIKVVDILINYQKEHPEDTNLLIADYLETYDAFSPLENELRYYIPMFYGREITAEYLVNRSKYYVAARLREEYINEKPRDPRVPDLLFKIAQDYETVASWKDLPVSEDFLPDVQKKASDSYLKYLDHSNNNDQSKFDKALEHAGSLYLLTCEYGGKFACDIQNITGMRNVYVKLVNKYPDHRLANNMLNWIAWSYCYEANLSGISDQQYIDAYRMALATYQQIAKNYPDGAIGENARKNIPIIEEKIKNPSNKTQFAPANWGW